jgi:hypothetical protein
MRSSIDLCAVRCNSHAIAWLIHSRSAEEKRVPASARTRQH